MVGRTVGIKGIDLRHFKSPNIRPKNCRSVPSFSPFLTFEDFVDFLFSPQNGIVTNDVTNDVTGDATMDDDQPLSDYFINSSHNSYLTGNQVGLLTELYRGRR